MRTIRDADQWLAMMPLLELAGMLNRAAEQMPEDDMSHVSWRDYSRTAKHVRVRLSGHYGSASDEELAGVLIMHLGTPSKQRSGLAEVVACLVEDELRSRYPGASEASDEALARMDFTDPQLDEYEYLWVLLRAARLFFC